MTSRAVGAAALALATAASLSVRAWSQAVDVERSRTLTMGMPAGGARVDRVDSSRTGRTRTALPTSGLRSEWRTPLGAAIEHAPLVDGHGETYVVGTRGEVIAVARDGTERWRVSTSATQPGPAALLSDETIVFADAAGEAVAVRGGSLRWRVRFGRNDAAHPAPLPLDDGGVVVATANDLAALDVDGRERARATLPEVVTAPLISAIGKIVAVATSGTVWAWVPGAPTATRIASFGSPVDGAAALADDHTLVAVTGGQLHLTAVDLVRGTAKTLAVAPANLWLGPPAMLGAIAHVLALTPTSELALSFDAEGNEVSRALVASHTAPLAVDGGAGTLPVAPRTPPLVDLAGALAFATSDGSIGVVGRTSVEIIAEACPRVSPPGALAGASARVGGRGAAVEAVAGLAPLAPGVFVAACHSGTLLALRGSASAGGDPSAPPL